VAPQKNGGSMSRAMYFEKGSKRRVRRIRWKSSEVVTALLFGLGVTAFSIYIAIWMMSHPFD
jgi:hypothetical protein